VIVEEAAREFGVALELVYGRGKNEPVVGARQVAMYFARETQPPEVSSTCLAPILSGITGQYCGR